LNMGGLPPGYFALPEQSIRGPIPDVLTLSLSTGAEEKSDSSAGLAVAEVPPRTRLVRRNEVENYARKADRISVHHRHGHVVAVLEIVSPGNKAIRNEICVFVEKTSDLIRQKIPPLVIDLFPPARVIHWAFTKPSGTSSWRRTLSCFLTSHLF